MLFWHGLNVILAFAVSAAIFYWLWRRSGHRNRATMLTLARHMPDAVLITDNNGLIIAYSPAACELFSYSGQELLTLNVEALMPPEFADKHQSMRESYMRNRRGQAMDNEVTCLSKSGERIDAVTRVRTFQLDGETFAYVSIQDVRQYKNREAALKNLSEHDPLTGLANRRLFDHDLEREWQRALRNNQPLTLMMIDVDFFKQYNDYYGHPQGDECLKQIAAIIQSIVQRATDCVARFGGEEFICLLPSLPLEAARQKAEALRSAIKNAQMPHQQSMLSNVITVSIGIATLVPREGKTADDLVAEADAALYRAKGSGRDCVQVMNNLI